MEEASPPLPDYLQPLEEGKLTPQCRDLLASLPADSSWISGSFCQYQGYWLPPLYLQALFEYRDRFQAHDSDVFLVTLPKSGTTWVKAILFTLVNRTRYDPTSPDHPLLSKNPHDLLIFLEYSINHSSEEKIPDFSTLIPPRIFYTHIPFALLPGSVKDSNCKVIYVCRNPKDVFVSLWNFVNKLRGSWRAHLTLDEAFDKFCSGVSLVGPYWDNVLGHWKESLANPGKMMFLKYEDLKKCPAVVVRKVAGFIACPFSPEEELNGVVEHIISLCSLEKLSSLEVNGSNSRVSTLGAMSSSFFRKGKVGDWTNYLTPEMVARIDTITEEKFRGSGLTF